MGDLELSVATAVEPAFRLGPSHLTGNAPSNAQVRITWPSGPCSATVSVARLSHSWLLKNQSSSAVSWVTPRLSDRLGYFTRPRSLWTNVFSPPSAYSSISYSAEMPLHSEK